jgi:hypothetical protein
MNNEQSLEECFETIITAIPSLGEELKNGLKEKTIAIKAAGHILRISTYKHERELAYQQIDLALNELRYIAELINARKQ